jgi:hypothetical protein
VSKRTDADSRNPGFPQEPEPPLGHGRSPRDPDTGSWVTLANIGLVGVPLAYTTSKSIAVTLIAAVLAIVAVLAHSLARRRR